jgi:hypothetical protein
MEKKQKLVATKSTLKGKGILAKLTVFFSIVFLFLAFGAFSTSAKAQDLQTIKLEQPETPTNSYAIEVTYVAYDLSGTDLNVVCSIQKLPAGTVTTFDPSNIKTANSGICSIPQTRIPADGEYEIKVLNDVTGGKSSSVKIIVDRVMPPVPTVYSKVSPSACTNRIDFTTGVDSDLTPTTKVEIFRGDSTTFVASPLTKLVSIDVGPGETKSSSEFTLPDCSKTYYYAIQAVDSIGNRSGFVGDKGTNVTYYIIEPTTSPGENGQGIGNGSGTGTGTGNGPGTGTGVTPSISPTGPAIDTNDTDGLVAGATDNNEEATTNNTLLIIFIVIGVVILGGFVFEIGVKKSED